MTDSRVKPITVTLAPATRIYLAAKAKEGFRSLNREVAMRIEESCTREQAAPPQEGQQP